MVGRNKAGRLTGSNSAPVQLVTFVAHLCAKSHLRVLLNNMYGVLVQRFA